MTFTLALPENAVLDATAIERTTAIARESGLSNEQAQKALELANTLAAEQRDAALAAIQPGGAEWARNLDNWKAETLADPTLGATLEERTAAIQRGAAVIDRFAQANPEQGAKIKEFLNTTGLGEKRELAHFFSWLGKAAAEPQSIPGPGTQQPGPSSPAKALYPNLP